MDVLGQAKREIQQEKLEDNFKRIVNTLQEICNNDRRFSMRLAPSEKSATLHSVEDGEHCSVFNLKSALIYDEPIQYEECPKISGCWLPGFVLTYKACHRYSHSYRNENIASDNYDYILSKTVPLLKEVLE